VTVRWAAASESVAVISSVMPRSALHFSAIALRFDTPVPNWRSVMFDCAQMVGKPVIVPVPAATPTAAAPVLRSERRVRPVFVLVVVSLMLVMLFSFSVFDCQLSRRPRTMASPAPQ
jgi:hypothetical protein